MARFNVNLLPKPRSRTGAWFMVALLSLIILTELVWRHQRLQQQQALAQALAQQQQPVDRHLAPKAPGINPEARQELNRFADTLTQPWEALLDDLQQQTGPDISLTRILPNLEKREVRLQGQASHNQAFLDYLKRLQSRPEWTHVEPQSQERDPQRPDKSVRFELVANWRAP